MSNLTSKDWWAAAAVRALKTAAQVAVATIGTTTALGGVDWAMVASTAALSAILSLLTSLGGLPEVSTESTTASTPAAAAATSDESTSKVIGTVSVDVPVVAKTEAATTTCADIVTTDGKEA